VDFSSSIFFFGFPLKQQSLQPQILSLIAGHLYFENPYSQYNLYDEDDEEDDYDEDTLMIEKVRMKQEVATQQLTKMSFKSREHHKRRKVVDNNLLDESEYVNVTLENLEQVPKVISI
jgi:hypothetical protein